MTALLALMLAATPVYGPPDTAAPEPYTNDAGQRVYTDEEIAIANENWRRHTRSAWTKFWVGQGLSMADAGLTCYALAQRNSDGTRVFREANPIFGNASCGKIVAFKAGIGALQYFLMRKAIEKDPRQSSRALNWILVLQGAPVLWNAVQITSKVRR